MLCVFVIGVSCILLGGWGWIDLFARVCCGLLLWCLFVFASEVFAIACWLVVLLIVY